MTINVHASSDRYDLVRAEIERLDPDIVFLPENTDRWAAGLGALACALSLCGRWPVPVRILAVSVQSRSDFRRHHHQAAEARRFSRHRRAHLPGRGE